MNFMSGGGVGENAEEDKQIDVYRQIGILRRRLKTLKEEAERLHRKAQNKLVTEEKPEKKIEKNIDPNNKADYDISEILVRAKQKFKEFDKNGNNVLDGDEVLNLSDWVWENFNLDVDGKPMRKIEKVKMASDLLKRCDKNDDGKIDYDEFAEWFVVTVNNAKKRASSPQLTPQVKEKAEKVVSEQGDYQKSYYRTKKIIKKAAKKRKIPETPWIHFIPTGQGLARNRVQLFLRLDRNHDMILDEKEMNPIFEKSGIEDKVEQQKLFRKFCEFFEAPSKGVSFKEFEALPAQANEKNLYFLIEELSRKL